MHKINFTKEYLTQQNYLDNKTLSEIAKENNCSWRTVSLYFKKFGLKVKKHKRLSDLNKYKFGKLKPIKPTTINKHGKVLWLCNCDCGNTIEISGSSLKSGNSSSCGCSKFKGCDNLSMTYYYILQNGALKRNLEFSVSIEYLSSLFLKQNGKCALSGLTIKLEKSYYGVRKREHTASLDRIDNSKGYVEGNVQWVHKDVNFLKGKFSEQKLLYLCQTIIDFNNERNKTFSLI